jgi:uncharacterized protein (TIGR03083 family)
VDKLRSPQPILVVDLFPEILDALLGLLAGLSTGDWREPTACPGWSVKDVALHLLGVEIGNLSRRRDGHKLPASTAAWEERVTLVNDLNQSWVRTARRMSTRLLIDLLQVTGVQMCQYFETLDPYAIGGPVSWAGPEPAPVWLDVAREYGERWHHQQHIRDAVGRPGLKQPRYLAPVLEASARALPQAFGPSPAPEGTCVTLTVLGPSGGRWSVVREGKAWRLYEGASPEPTVEVTMDEDLAWRLYTKGASPAQARERSTVAGDPALAARVFEVTAIIA